MFKEIPYLVGSSLTRENFRDVDVRIILGKYEYKRLSYSVDIERLNMIVSLWGQKVTGLPIDFQIQGLVESSSHAGEVRNALQRVED